MNRSEPRQDKDRYRDREAAGSDGPSEPRPEGSGVDPFWRVGREFDSVTVSVEAPQTPLALLERLGPSPFERGRFPVIGFLAATYDKVTRYALSRR